MTRRTRLDRADRARGLCGSRRAQLRLERLGTEHGHSDARAAISSSRAPPTRRRWTRRGAFDNESIWVFQQIYETLYIVTPDGKGVKPWLATSYDLSKDKLTYTFHLRKGVKFHTGQEMTADDVKFSIDAARNPKTGWGYIDTAIKSVTVKDKYTVVIKTKYQWAPMVADIALFNNSIVPKNYGGKTEKAFFDAPVGTGPFKWDHWTQGQGDQVRPQRPVLAEGQAVPGQRDLDVRRRRQHAPPAAQGRPGADRRVPRLGAGQAAEGDGRRHDDAVPVHAHRLRALQPALQAVPGRARAPRDLVPDRPQGADQGDPVRQRHAWPTRSCRRRCRTTTRSRRASSTTSPRPRRRWPSRPSRTASPPRSRRSRARSTQATIAQVIQAAGKPLGIKVNILKKDGNAWQADW